MSIFWTIYLVTTLAMIAFVILVNVLFKPKDSEKFSISYIIIALFVGVVPILNLVAFVAYIILFIFALSDKEFIPKY